MTPFEAQRARMRAAMEDTNTLDPSAGRPEWIDGSRIAPRPSCARSLEEELKRALARQEPSEDFTARVLAKVASERRPVSTRSWQWAAIAAATLIIAGSVGLEHQHRQDMRGEAAKHQLLTALRIAGTKLQLAQTRVQESEVSQ